MGNTFAKPLAFFFLVLSTATANGCDSNPVVVLIGPAGSGKSKASTLLGCPRMSCSSTADCSDDVAVCCGSNSHYVMDTVGFNSALTTEVEIDGTKVTLSGMSSPLFALFEAFEKHKISSAMFFALYVADAVRGGNDEYNEDAITKMLGCKSRRVLTKFRAEEPDHVAVRTDDDDLIILQNETGAPDLQGPVCTFLLPAKWREMVVANDFTAMKSISDATHCALLRDEKDGLLKRIAEIRTTAWDHNACTYEKTTHIGGCVFVMPHSGYCIPYPPMKSTEVDHDCVNRRDAANRRATELNNQGASDKASMNTRVSEIDKKYAEECGNLPVNVL